MWATRDTNERGSSLHCGRVLVAARSSSVQNPADPIFNYPSATLTKRNGNREWRIHAGKEMCLLFFWRTVLYLTLLRFVLFALLFLLCSAGVALLCFACFPLLLVALQMKLNGHSNCIVLLCFVIGEFWTVMVKLG